MNEEHSPRPHLIVRASAGSGKTYQLLRRLIGLLVDGEKPESILAATFSRKAAGEFRSKLLSAVADAVSLPENAQNLANQIGHPAWSAPDFQQLLFSLVRNPDSLRLCTIDAFFLELIGLFRLELGLGTEVHLASETADDFETRDLLRTIFTSANEEIRQAVFHLIEEDRGADSIRSFQETLERWIANAQSLYRSAPDASLWGALPHSVQLPEVSLEEWQSRLRKFERSLLSQEIPAEAAETVASMLEIFKTWDLSPTLPKEVQKWMTAAAEDRAKLRQGEKGFIVNRKKVTLTGESGRALIELGAIYHAMNLKIAVRNTRGAFAFLRMYEKEYQMRRLRKGAIRFADLPLLLSAIGEFANTVLAYRLDASLHHWLLDEFQDTSRSQWQVIEPLIEELFYDTETARSFFCVGDPKQAIYGWRQGDSRLFGQILQKFGRFQPRPLEERTLARTYRCAPAIINFANRLFGSGEAFPTDLDPAVVSRWMDTWIPHESANEKIPGRVEVTVAASDDARDEAVVEFLLEKRPWENHHSTAILCRKNKEANRFETLLRSRGIPTIRDGARSVKNDFQVGRLLHAIFQVLAHPGDSAALAFLHYGSTAGALRAFCGSEISPESLRSQWEKKSVDDFLLHLQNSLQKEGLLDRSELHCLRVVHSLFRNLDARNGASLRGILRTLQQARIEDTGDRANVQILTIHRSKGLEFDFVLLPDLDAKTTPGNTREFWVNDDHGQISGILESVRKDVRAAFPPLEQWGNSVEQERKFEALCVHYVAITRAALSLHLFLGEKKGKAKTGIHRWIEQAFSVEALPGMPIQLGEPIQPMPAEKIYPQPPWDPPPPELQHSRKRLNRKQSPSQGKENSRISPFLQQRSHGLQLGRRIHEALAQHEWPARDLNLAEHHPEIAKILTPVLQHPKIQPLLSPQSTPTKVWREKAFEAAIDNTWFSGIFDRIHLPKGWEQKKSRPRIIDFKTDTTPKNKESHKEQIHLYRKALARILGIEEEQIDCCLVFLRTTEVAEL